MSQAVQTKVLSSAGDDGVFWLSDVTDAGMTSAPTKGSFTPQFLLEESEIEAEGMGPNMERGRTRPPPQGSSGPLELFLIHSSNKLSWASIGFQPYTRG